MNQKSQKTFGLTNLITYTLQNKYPLTNCLMKDFMNLTLEKILKIANGLKITKEKQIIILKEKGILKINEEHTYDTSLRGDIY